MEETKKIKRYKLFKLDTSFSKSAKNRPKIAMHQNVKQMALKILRPDIGKSLDGLDLLDIISKHEQNNQ